MTIHNRLYFDTPDYTASYDYDDQSLKLVGIHVDNRQLDSLTIEIRNGSDDSLVRSFTIPPQTRVDRALTGAEQADVILDARGRVTNLYGKTV